MARVILDIELLSAASFSASNATAGDASTLTGLPGASLWGAAANLLSDIDGFFDAFIGGKIIFSDGLPVIDGTVCVPTPLSLHNKKTDTDEIFNLGIAERPEGIQLEQLRGGYVGLLENGNLFRFSIETASSMRTALGRDGRARDRHLHVIQTVPAGTCYRTSVEAEDSQLLDRVLKALTKPHVRIGRSRTAELGRFKLTPRNEEGGVNLSMQSTDTFLLLCLSDIALRDPTTGSPSYDLAHLGLPEGYSVDLARSFIRTRRYTPFNGYRKSHELERLVLQAGSVICVKYPGAVSPSQLREWAAQRVGDYKNVGLGQLVVNPLLLQDTQPRLTKLIRPEATSKKSMPEDALGQFIRSAQKQVDARSELEKWLNESADYFKGLGVSRSQWGQVREKARAARRSGQSSQELNEDLQSWMGQGETKLIWEKKKGGKTARAAFEKSANSVPNGIPLMEALEELGSRMASEISQGRLKSTTGGEQ